MDVRTHPGWLVRGTQTVGLRCRLRVRVWCSVFAKLGRLSLFRILIPDTPRAFPAQRWVRISLRTLHLIAVAGVGGGFLYAAEPAMWVPYLWLAVVTGAAMVAVELWSTGLWLIQVRGLSVVVKLGLFAWLLRTDHLQLPLLIAVIVISGVVAHAPADVRYFSVFHWRRVDGL